MNDLYKPVDVTRLMELAGTKKLPEADVPTDYRTLASPEVQANYSKGGQNPDPTDPIIAHRMGANVPQADIARAAQTRPEGPTSSVTTPTATATAAPTAVASVPDAQDFGSEPKITTPAPTVNTSPAAPARPAYAGSAGSQAIQKLNPAIKDVNKIQAGQKITLPSGETYTVKKGDTLDRIAAAAKAEDDRREQVPVSPEVQAQLSRPVATNPAAPRTDVPIGAMRPGAANAGRMRPASQPSTAPVRTNPELGFGPGKRAPVTAADYQALRGTPTPPTVPAPRLGPNAQARPMSSFRETASDLARMQNLAGIRKN